MLSWNEVIDQIKDEISMPNHMLEKSDQDIIKYVKRKSLGILNQEKPDVNKIYINLSDPSLKVEHRINEFYISDPDDRDIIQVTEFIPAMGGEIILGKSILPIMNYEQVPEYLLNNFTTNNAKAFSGYNYNYEFLYPNILRISPSYNQPCVIEYERKHDEELTTIPASHHEIFKKLALGHVMQWIGRLRTNYQSIQTPFGEIQLNGDNMKSDGAELVSQAMEELKLANIPEVCLDIG